MANMLKMEQVQFIQQLIDQGWTQEVDPENRTTGMIKDGIWFPGWITRRNHEEKTQDA